MLSAVLARHEEGIRESRIALQLDPLNNHVLTTAGRAYFSARQYDSAVALFNRAREIEPTMAGAEFALAKVYLAKGALERSASLLDSAIAQGRNRRQAIGLLGYIQAKLNQPERARETLRELERTSVTDNVWDAIAVVRLGMGDHDGAIAAFEKALVSRPNGLLNLLATDPVLDPPRRDPRFIRMLEQKKLPTQLAARASH